MENSSLVNQTLNSSELQSLLGEGGQIALNVFDLLFLALPMLLTNGFIIIVLLKDKTTIAALRVALINLLVGAMTSGVSLIIWVLAHLANIAQLVSESSKDTGARVSSVLLSSSFTLRSTALSILAVVVYTIVKKGPPKKAGVVWCLLVVAVGLFVSVLALNSALLSDSIIDHSIAIDGYYTFYIFSSFGKYWFVGTGLALEIQAKTVTFTFALLAFRHVRRSVSAETAAETGVKKAMLKFLIIMMTFNLIVSIFNLPTLITVLFDRVIVLLRHSGVFYGIIYTSHIILATSSILIPIIVTIQFRSVSKAIKDLFGCSKSKSAVAPTVHD